MEYIAMKANNIDILKLIQSNSGSQFVIPIYQRNYTWSNEHVDRLLKDLEKLVNDTSLHHFIGTIIFLEAEGKHITELSIVDGQQRIITVFLMLYALRNIAKKKSSANPQQFKDLYEKIETKYLLNNGRTEETTQQRLRPSSIDNQDYCYVVSGEDLPKQKHTNKLMNAYNKIHGRLTSLLAKNISPGVLLSALQRFDVVSIELDQEDNAQQIFESINSTGIQLSYADLIRNFIMMGRPDEIQVKIYQQYWQYLEQLFNDSNRLTRFLRLYLISKTTEDSIKQGQVDTYQKFREFWNSQLDQDTFDFEKILDEIKRYSDHYKNLHMHIDDSCIFKKDIEDYKKLNIDSLSPFTMDVLENYYQKRITKEQAQKVLHMLVSYIIRLKLNQVQMSNVQKFTPFLLRKVRRAIMNNYENYCDICAYYLKEGQTNVSMPNNRATIEHAKVAANYEDSLVKFILNKIENHNNPVPFDPVQFNKLSIEHIMPRTPTTEWLEMSSCTTDEYKNYVGLLGNLTLCSTKDNSSNGNKSFKHKKERLSLTRHLKLNEYILQKDCWNPTTINERTDKLISKLLCIYPYCETSWKPEDNIGDVNVTLRFKGTVSKGIWKRGDVLRKNAIEILKGSQIVLNREPESESDWPIALQNLKHGECETNGKVFYCELKENYLCKSPSKAAEFVTQASKNGWEYWRDEYGTPINNLRRQRV